MMSTEVREYLNSRLVPLETQLQGLLNDLSDINKNLGQQRTDMESRDADLRRAEVRVSATTAAH